MTQKPYEQPISHQQKKRTSSGLISLLWMLVGALIAVMIGFFLYLSPLFDGFKTEVDVNPPTKVEPLPQQEETNDYEFYEVLPKREFQTGGSVVGEADQVASSVEVEPDAVVASNKTRGEVTQDDAPDGSVSILEEGEVVAIEEPLNKENTNEGSIKVTTTQNSYILQIRSYDNPEDADRMRAEVMMSGVDARIIKRMDNGMELYQVISNIMNSKEEVMRASQRLSDNGIDSLIVEQKR